MPFCRQRCDQMTFKLADCEGTASRPNGSIAQACVSVSNTVTAAIKADLVRNAAMTMKKTGRQGPFPRTTNRKRRPCSSDHFVFRNMEEGRVLVLS